MKKLIVLIGYICWAVIGYAQCTAANEAIQVGERLTY